MIILNKRNEVQMVQGDVGGIEFSLHCKPFKDVDKCCLIVTKDSNKIFKINGVVTEGICYFPFVKDTTININPDIYLFHVKVKSESNSIEGTVISGNKFELKRGFDCD